VELPIWSSASEKLTGAGELGFTMREREDWQRESAALRRAFLGLMPSSKDWIRGQVALVRLLGIAWRELLDRVGHRLR
jgi:hypothetical protein